MVVRMSFALLAAAGCGRVGFDASNSTTDGDVTDSSAACVIAGVDLCSMPPETALLFGSGVIDTDSDPRCRDVSQAGGPTACLIYASAVVVGPGVSLRGIGTKPLIIASSTSIGIDGLIDVSSRGAERGAGGNFPGCAPFPSMPVEDTDGSGGGAGAAFGSAGGRGGGGDIDDTAGLSAGGIAPAAIVAPSIARGGCAGQPGARVGSGGGAAGDGGGALWLLALDRIDVSSTGQLRATGAGGLGVVGANAFGAGGGGGSGGSIRLAAPAVTIAGIASANGGAGAGGGGAGIPGSPGADGNFGTTPADGGSGAGPGGRGGDGGAIAAAMAGVDSTGGAGGGGAGVGFVILPATATVTGTVSPVPTLL